MRLFTDYKVIAAVGLLSLAPFLRSQTPLSPPAQNYVAAIGDVPLRAPATADFALGSSFTLEGWFYLTGNTPYAWLMGKGLATSGSDPFVSFALQLNNDGTKLAFVTSTGAAGTYRELVAPAALPLRTWTHIAAVLENGATTRLLVNGAVVATGTAAGTPLAAPTVPFGLGIAYLANGNTNYPAFPGLARQVRLWSTARTAAQTSADASVALPADRSGLVAAWPLDESSGATARDLSGNNRPLTANAGTISAMLLAVLEEGPFYAFTSTAVTDNSLQNLDDGQLIDFDSDGDLDLVLVQTFSPPTLPETRTRLRAFRNSNGTFVDVTDAVLGNVTMVHPRHSFVGDFNGDGRPDLLYVGHGTDTPPFPGEQSKLLIQTPDGRLVDESGTRLPQRSSFTHNVAVADIDGDGDLDIYMANVNGGAIGPRIYLNNGAGVFTESTDRLPSDIANRTGGRVFTASLLVDVNGDNRPDLILGGENSAPNEILLNNGSGTFVRNAAFTLPPKFGGPDWSTVALATADFNGDGAPDLLLGTTGGSELLADGRTITGYGIAGLQLLLNRGDGTFYDATTTAGFTWSSNERWVVWTRIADLDGDGRPDILAQVRLVNGTTARVFLNRGAGRFVDATGAYGSIRGSYFLPADFDRDGRTDIVSGTRTSVNVARNVKNIDRAVFQSTPDDPGRLANLSVRTQAGTGDQTLITGFALGGSGTKPLLVRAVGPTLSAFGLTGTLPDPFVEIALLNAAKVAENNNWAGAATLKAAFTSVGAFGLAADTSLDAALVFAPSAGAYTAKITDTADRTGLALVELYDTGTGNTPKLTNVSARTQVGTGADALIVGFVVSGNVPKKFLIRAVGPTLGAFGVGGTLVDPVLDVRPLGSENIVATNDDWRGTAALKAAFTSVGAFGFAAETSRDAALAIELPPGAYTATVTGKNNTRGVALVEVYELP